MTIAIVLNTAWNIYNFRLGLIKGLLAEGHEVLAIAPPDEYVPQIEATGARFIDLKHLSRKGTNPVKDLQLVQELRRIYEQEQVDVALQYTIKPNIYGSMAAAPIRTRAFCTVTGLGYSFLSRGLVNQVAKRLYKYAFRRADRIFFQNKDDRQLFMDLGLVSGKKTSIIPGSGIDTDFFAPQYNQPVEDGIIRFLFVGRLLYDKGIRELMDAVDILSRKYSNFSIELIGKIDEGNPSAIQEAPFREWLEDHPQAHYAGTTNDVRSYMAKADVVVLPSYREGLPRVMLEGLSMAKPLIATDVAGCRETVIHGENGFLVKVKNSAALAGAMQRIIEMSPEQRAAMGQKGRALALERFDEKRIIDRYKGYIGEVVIK